MSSGNMERVWCGICSKSKAPPQRCCLTCFSFTYGHLARFWNSSPIQLSLVILEIIKLVTKTIFCLKHWSLPTNLIAITEVPLEVVSWLSQYCTKHVDLVVFYTISLWEVTFIISLFRNWVFSRSQYVFCVLGYQVDVMSHSFLSGLCKYWAHWSD